MPDFKSEREQLAILENLYSQQKYSEIEELAKSLKKDYPSSFQIRLLRVKALRELNRLPEAEEILNELTKQYPENVNILMELGDVLSITSRYQEALDIFNKILFLDPFHPTAKDKIVQVNKLLAQIPTKPVDVTAVPPPPPPSDTPAETPPPPPEDQAPVSFADRMEEQMKEFSDEAPKDEVIQEAFDAPPEEPPKTDSQIDDLPESEKTDPGLKRAFEEGMNELDLNGQFTDSADLEALQDIETEESKIPAMQVPQESVPEPPPPPAEPQEPIEAPTEQVPQVPSPEGEAEPESSEDNFITESAAELYLSQGLYSEALSIFEKLYQLKKDETILQKIEDVKSKRLIQKKIQMLSDFLKIIQNKGE